MVAFLGWAERELKAIQKKGGGEVSSETLKWRFKGFVSFPVDASFLVGPQLLNNQQFCGSIGSSC